MQVLVCRTKFVTHSNPPVVRILCAAHSWQPANARPSIGATGSLARSRQVYTRMRRLQHGVATTKLARKHPKGLICKMHGTEHPPIVRRFAYHEVLRIALQIKCAQVRLRF